MSTLKTPTSFRISKKARELLGRLATLKGISQAAILELIIREYAKKEGIK